MGPSILRKLRYTNANHVLPGPWGTPHQCAKSVQQLESALQDVFLVRAITVAHPAVTASRIGECSVWENTANANNPPTAAHSLG